jgi:hypothetical protein
MPGLQVFTVHPGGWRVQQVQQAPFRPEGTRTHLLRHHGLTLGKSPVQTGDGLDGVGQGRGGPVWFDPAAHVNPCIGQGADIPVPGLDLLVLPLVLLGQFGLFGKDAVAERWVSHCSASF